MIFNVAAINDFFLIACDAIDFRPSRSIIVASCSSAKKGEDRERIRERYAIYCVTLHVIIVVVVYLFLEFLSGIITTLGQLKTRVPTGQGVYNVESLNKGMCNGGDKVERRGKRF